MPKENAEVKEEEAKFGPTDYNYEEAMAVEPDEKPVEEANDISPAEEQARSQGWLPQDEYEGDADNWVDAREFNFRGELMGRISNQGKQLSSYSKEVDELKKSLQSLGDHNRKIAEIERQKALDSLKRQKVNALENDDHVAAVEIDDKIQDIKAEVVEEPAAPQQAPAKKPAHPDFVAWVNSPENSWYKSDRMLHGIANVYAQEYATANNAAADPDNFDVAGMMAHVATQIKQQFPEKLGLPKHSHSPQVNEPQNSGRTVNRGKKAKFSERDLDEMQLQVGRTFVKSNAFDNIQEYVDQLAALGELPSQRGV